MSLRFSACSRKTLGAELEFQLLDHESLDLTDRILPLLERAAENPLIKAEIIQNTVEVNSPVCDNASELNDGLRDTVAELLDHCSALGLRLAGAGTHPFCRRLGIITPLPRYRRMEKEAGYLSHNQITYATQVHVGMASGNEAIRVMQRMTPCLPLILALSASSPFWRGYDTGHASYRLRLLAASPDFGIPPYFNNWQGFCSFFEAARRAGMARTIKDVHWDIRPHSDLGTLEVRVMDAQPTVRRSVMLAALIHIMVVYFAETPLRSLDARLPRRLPVWIEKRNHYEAGRLGVEANYIANERGDTRPMLEMIGSLFDVLSETAHEMGYAQAYRELSELPGEPSYRRQRQVLEHGGSMRAVCADLVRELEDEIQLAAA